MNNVVWEEQEMMGAIKRKAYKLIPSEAFSQSTPNDADSDNRLVSSQKWPLLITELPDINLRNVISGCALNTAEMGWSKCSTETERNI